MAEATSTDGLNDKLHAAETTPELLRALKKLFSELGPQFGPQCYHDSIITAGYDSTDSLKSITWDSLVKLGVLRGHACKVLEAIRGVLCAGFVAVIVFHSAVTAALKGLWQTSILVWCRSPSSGTRAWCIATRLVSHCLA